MCNKIIFVIQKILGDTSKRPVVTGSRVNLQLDAVSVDIVDVDIWMTTQFVMLCALVPLGYKVTVFKSIEQK